MDARKNACVLLSRAFFLASIYFLPPATPANVELECTGMPRKEQTRYVIQINCQVVMMRFGHVDRHQCMGIRLSKIVGVSVPKNRKGDR